MKEVKYSIGVDSHRLICTSLCLFNGKLTSPLLSWTRGIGGEGGRVTESQATGIVLCRFSLSLFLTDLDEWCQRSPCDGGHELLWVTQKPIQYRL